MLWRVAEMGAELVVSTSATARGPLGLLPHAKVWPGHLPPPSPETRSTYMLGTTPLGARPSLSALFGQRASFLRVFEAD